MLRRVHSYVHVEIPLATVEVQGIVSDTAGACAVKHNEKPVVFGGLVNGEVFLATEWRTESSAGDQDADDRIFVRTPINFFGGFIWFLRCDGTGGVGIIDLVGEFVEYPTLVGGGECSSKLVVMCHTDLEGVTAGEDQAIKVELVEGVLDVRRLRDVTRFRSLRE